MKIRVLIITAVIIAVIFIGFGWFKQNTKKHSPSATVTTQIGSTQVTINYCRPSKKGRLIFGTEEEKALQPYGAYWRVGANEATTLETTKDINFNGSVVKAGKYQLYAYPGKDVWKIVLNTEWDRWGAREANHESDVLTTEVTANNKATFEEVFTINFLIDSTGTTLLSLHWDEVEVKVPITEDK